MSVKSRVVTFSQTNPVGLKPLEDSMGDYELANGNRLFTGGNWYNGQKAPDATYVSNPTIEGVDDLVESQGNPLRKLREAKGQVGGNFAVIRRTAYSVPTEYVVAANGNGEWQNVTQRYYGRIYPHGPQGIFSEWWPESKWSSDSDLDEFGTTAIARVEPTNPLSGLTVFLAELKREGIPSVPGIQLWKDKTSLAKSAGGEYLNKEFGWDPVLGDIRKFVNVSRNAQRHIDQYSRGSGRKIHRQFILPKEEQKVVHTATGHNNLWPALNWANFLTVPPSQTRTYTTTIERWFEGVFTYYLPPYKVGGSNFERNRRLAHKLYGASITPDTIWNLTPWSWAVDWVTNAGDVFHNIGAFRDNGLVMQYGYVMETITHRMEWEVSNIRLKTTEGGWGPHYGNPPGPLKTKFVMETVTKRRRTATPYGFGLTWEGFNPFQLSILAALGLSKGR